MIPTLVKYKDGIIYHDYQFNIPFTQVYAHAKEQGAHSFYTSLLLSSDYRYIFIDPLIDETYKDSTTTAVFGSVSNDMSLTYMLPKSGSDYALSAVFAAKPINLPVPVTRCCVYARYQADPVCAVTFQVSPDQGATWIDAPIGTELSISSTSTLLFRANLSTQNPALTPRLIDYAILAS